MVIKRSKSSGGKDFKKYIKDLYLQRLETLDLTATNSKELGSIKIISRRKSILHTNLRSEERAKSSSLLNIKKVTKGALKDPLLWKSEFHLAR